MGIERKPRTQSINPAIAEILKIHGQPIEAINPPARRIPVTAPRPPNAAKTEKARVRAGPGGKLVAISAMAVGIVPAAPIPCNARAIINMIGDVENETTMAQSENQKSPARNILRCPNRSPRRPETSRRPAKAMVYALRIQMIFETSKFKSSAMGIIATDTEAPLTKISQRERRKAKRGQKFDDLCGEKVKSI